MELKGILNYFQQRWKYAAITGFAGTYGANVLEVRIYMKLPYSEGVFIKEGAHDNPPQILYLPEKMIELPVKWIFGYCINRNGNVYEQDLKN